MDDPAQNFADPLVAFVALKGVPGSRVLGDDQVQVGADPGHFGASALGGEGIAGQVGPLDAVVVDPEAVAIAPFFLGLAGLDEIVGLGRCAEIILGDDLLAVPMAVVEPEPTDAGGVAGRWSRSGCSGRRY